MKKLTELEIEYLELRKREKMQTLLYFISIISLSTFSFFMGIFVMQVGWGLEIKSWFWLIVGFIVQTIILSLMQTITNSAPKI